jgi:ketosteroid isomerase-like protein
MIARRFLSVGMLALGAALAAVPGPAAAQQHPSDEQRIRQLDRDWVAKVVAKDLAGIVAFYAKDGVLMAPDGPPAEGTAAITEGWRGILGLPNGSLTFAPTRVAVAKSADLAYETGTYSLGFDGPKGRVEDTGKYVVVWKKEASQWKAAADIFNTNLAPPQ